MNYTITESKELKSRNYSASPKDISAERREKSLSLIKKGIWLYFLLLIFEGALRKWVLPGLATPLLVVRDPIAIGIMFLCFQRGLFKLNSYIAVMWLISFVAYCTAIIAGHGNMLVALYGIRILALHFPLIFAIGWVFDKEDVVKMGKAMLWITIPMTILMAMQFYSPQSAWVNQGVGGDEGGAGFSGALGFFRPPGTFSFTNGLALFYGLAAAYVFYFWLDNSKTISKLILLAATACLLAAIPFSISRTVFFEIILSAVFVLVATTTKPKYFVRLISGSLAIVVLIAVLSNFNFFQTGVEVFTKRFESANKAEEGLEGIFVDRFLGGMVEAITDTEDLPFFGRGIGMGTNVGAMMLSGELKFLISEGEWGRLIGEMGLLLGLGVILLRLLLTFKMGITSFQAMRESNFLPWMLISFSSMNLLQGQWAQPTSLGFSILASGLVLAALKIKKD